MVEATNYAFLIILTCLQYLGVEHSSYEMTLNYSKIENHKTRPPETLVLTKNKDKNNEWIITIKNKDLKIPISVVKDSITVFERGTNNTNITKFDEIDFDRLEKQQDTIFNKKQKAVAIVRKNNKNIEFKILDNWFYEQIRMEIKE